MRTILFTTLIACSCSSRVDVQVDGGIRPDWIPANPRVVDAGTDASEPHDAESDAASEHPECNDFNECTLDSYNPYVRSCDHWGLTNLAQCGDGGRCDGNQDPPACCEGKIVFVDGRTVCEPKT